ncbi:hypothetical protein KEM56_006945 [Ascosphaera pollenicola]|nr:hypothetical protein KEM56_006945 [Ascosphaera pollenicola]
MEELAFHFLCPPPAKPSECEHYDSSIRSTVSRLVEVPPASYDSDWQALEVGCPSSYPFVLSLSADQPLSLHQRASPGPQTLYYSAALAAILEKYQFTPGHARIAALYPKALEFLQSYDTIQVRYVGQSWRRILEFTLSYADRLQPQDSDSAILPVRDAILRLDPTGSVLTSSHILFVNHCLRRRAFSLALPLLDKDIYHIPSAKNDEYAKSKVEWPCDPDAHPISFITTESGLTDELNARRVLEYFLYGAMIYMGLSNWERAIHFLEIVIRAPTRSCVSKIQLEAYKKWISANLIAYGTVHYPHGELIEGSSALLNLFVTPYTNVAEVFKGDSYSGLRQEVDTAKSVWDNDRNAGLMKQVLQAYKKHALIEIGRTLKAVPVSDLNSYLPFQEPRMEAFLEYLIDHGDLQASLSSPDPSTGTRILRFESPPEKSPGRPKEMTDAELKQLIQQKTTQMGLLSEHVKEMKDKLSLRAKITGKRSR